MKSILLIDDDPAVIGFLESAFRRAGYAVATAFTGHEALEAYASDSRDLVLLDLNLPDMSGLVVLERLRSTDPDATVIMLTAQADLETAVQAMHAGAENFLPKPVDLPHLYAAAARAFEKLELRRRTRYLESRVRASGPTEPEPDSATGPMAETMRMVSLIAPATTTALILGETGTGKSWIAQNIHARSPRARQAFVELNCAALNATFLSSELFGHEKGAFTDARTLKRGLLEVADGGTLFLDEIGDIAAELQPKLLTVLETRRFRRLGGTRDIESDVRLIAATNRDLRKAVENGTFREDLYYRLAVMPIVLPPLRERPRSELQALAGDLLMQLQPAEPRRGFSAEAMELLTSYHWPGNIREMRNVIERALILSGGEAVIRPAHFPPELRPSAGTHSPADDAWQLTLQQVQDRHVLRVIEECGGNRSRAARVLGISRAGLYKMLRRMEESAGA